ncbi:MAG TPA: adenylyltransferase/cytidyltransferase family protein [Methylomirabilota bacterium]|nr:adenylyltransferase/cytidyltransferase family protein [Methylomirabilota bacterium]
MKRPEEKIVEIAALESRLKSAPGEREGLVLANGIFDLFHVGHVRYLEGARRAGRSLLVALNSDASARRLKGAGRPVLPIAERMEMVAALQCVDWVTCFEEETVESLLRRLLPAAHAKGTDYTVESVPERAVAESLGIRTVIVGDPKHHATSDLIRLIRKSADPEGSGRG